MSEESCRAKIFSRGSRSGRWVTMDSSTAWQLCISSTAPSRAAAPRRLCSRRAALSRSPRVRSIRVCCTASRYSATNRCSISRKSSRSLARARAALLLSIPEMTGKSRLITSAVSSPAAWDNGDAAFRGTGMVRGGSSATSLVTSVVQWKGSSNQKTLPTPTRWFPS